MIDIILGILTFPLLVLELAAGALKMSAPAFVAAATSAKAQSAAITIAFLAGVSEMLGQSVILVINRVALYRFVASLAFTGMTYLTSAMIWALSAFLIVPLTTTLEVGDLSSVIGVVALAFAPRLFGVLALAPYFGVALGNILEVWAMVLVVFGLSVTTGLPLHAAMLCGALGWLASYALRAFLGHILAKPLRRVRIAVAGTALDRSPQHIIDELVETLKKSLPP